MKAVVLQPMYLPWMGYFGMIDQADVLVFYDDVQFSRDSWQQRNRIKIPNDSGQTKWLKVPVIKNFGQSIKSVQIDQDREWATDHFSLIKSAYGPSSVPFGPESADYFHEYIGHFEDIYNGNWRSLRDLNAHLIKKIANILGITDVEYHYSSELNIHGSGTEKLVKTLKYINADEYISGPGAKDYIEIGQFEDNDIALYWHEFDHPEYNQLYGEFVSHLSIIDALFNAGDATLSLIRFGEEDALVQEV